jgi:hypothetical protein
MFHSISKKDFKGFRPAARLAALVGMAAGSAFAQPEPPPAPYLACQQEPTGVAANDTVAAAADAEGFTSLFDGATQKGWWQSCQTGHGGPAKWKIVPEEKAIYSSQDGNKGSILMTNKKFLHYELVWDYWPDFGNDGGIFNRTPANGRCFQTVLDYIGGASLGGTWGEGGFTSRDYRPFSFAGNERSLTIPGNGQGEPSNWTTITQKMKSAGQQFDCPASGCTQADWQRLWDFEGWNQLRIKFYGGVTGNNRVRMKFWFRKVGATDWIPVSADTTLMQVLPENYIGLQVHGGGRFGGPRGTWYRNIKWQPIDGATGDRLRTVSSLTLDGRVKSDIRATSHALVGEMDSDYRISIKDARGREVQVVNGSAGRFEHAFAPRANGWLTLEIKSAKGVERRSIIRDVN